MLKMGTSMVLWLGRATVFVVGLAVVLALVLGVASTAFGANGDLFRVGKSNFASATSMLAKSGAGPALKLMVDSGPPLAVNSPTKVTNLNADKIDGHDAPLWANIRPDGSTFSSFGVTSSSKQSVDFGGRYHVSFDRDVSRCAYVGTLGNNAGTTVPGEISVTARDPATDPNTLFIQTFNSAGSASDKPFHLAVLC